MIALRDSQKAIVRECAKRQRALVISPMGSGKTLAILTFLLGQVYQKKVCNVLIVAPLRVAKSVWVQENEKYGIGLNIRYFKRLADLKLWLCEPLEHRVAVCSVTRIDEIPSGCWDAVILDESTLFGNKSSKRSAESRRLCKNVPIRILLTGTPIHGGYEKLFHQVLLADGGEALGKSLQTFRDNYMRVKYKAMGVVTVYEIDPSKIHDLMEKVRPVIINIRDEVKLPPLIVNDIYVDLPKPRRKEYDELEEMNVMVFKAETGRSPYATAHSLVAFSASALGMKLRQLASGYTYPYGTKVGGGTIRRNDTMEYAKSHTEKMKVLSEIVEVSERGVMVLYQFQSELAELKRTFPNARTLNDNEDIEAWNRGEVSVILVHPQSVGWGLNLQFGGNVVVWFSLTYDAELYAQANKRIYRSGQTDSVSLIHIIARDTIDEKILKVLRDKEKVASDFIKE